MQMVQRAFVGFCSRKVLWNLEVTYSNDVVGTVTPDNTKS